MSRTARAIAISCSTSASSYAFGSMRATMSPLFTHEPLGAIMAILNGPPNFSQSSLISAGSAGRKLPVMSMATRSVPFFAGAVTGSP